MFVGWPHHCLPTTLLDVFDVLPLMQGFWARLRGLRLDAVAMAPQHHAGGVMGLVRMLSRVQSLDISCLEIVAPADADADDDALCAFLLRCMPDAQRRLVNA